MANAKKTPKGMTKKRTPRPHGLTITARNKARRIAHELDRVAAHRKHLRDWAASKNVSYGLAYLTPISELRRAVKRATQHAPTARDEHEERLAAARERKSTPMQRALERARA